MTRRLVLAVAALLLAGEVPAGADGTIDAATASLAAGAAPSAGEVTVDRCAPPNGLPEIPSIAGVGALEPMPGTLRAFPGGGSGSDGAFHAIQDVTLPGGTYEYTTYTVDAGVTVKYSEPVTIRTTGATAIDGAVCVTPTGGAITLHSAGPLTVADDSSLEIRDAPGHLDLAAAGDVAIGNDARIFGSRGLTFTVHGIGTAQLGAGRFAGGEGDLIVLSAGGIETSGGSLDTTIASLRVEARGGDLHLADTYLSALSQGLDIAASGSVELSGATGILTGGGRVRVTAYGGDLTLRGDAQIGNGVGRTDLRAAGSMTFEDRSNVTATEAVIDIRTFAGDVVFVSPAATGSCKVDVDSGDVIVTSARDVLVNDAAIIESVSGSTTLLAPAGSILFGGAPTIQGGADATIRARDVVSGAGLDFLAGSGDVSAGSAGIDLAFGSTGAETTGDLRVLSEGDVRLSGRIVSSGDLSVASCEGDVTLTGAQISTADRTGLGGGSGDVLVETFGGAPTTIDLAGATLATGDADDVSGRIDVLARHATAFLPLRVRLRLPPGKRKRLPGLKLRGVLDTGPTDIDLTLPAILDVGGASFALPGLAPGRGRRLEYRDDVLLLRVTPARNGSSRARIVLKLASDLTGRVEPDGSLLLRYRSTDLNARGRVDLTGGRFRLGRVPGTLQEPGLYLTTANVRLHGDGRDAFSASADFAGPADIPATAPDVQVRLGAGADATIPSASFRRRGKRFVFRGDVNGVRRVVIDYRKGRVLVAGKRTDFGEPVEGQQPLAFTLRLGADERTVHVGAVRKGRRLRH